MELSLVNDGFKYYSSQDSAMKYWLADYALNMARNMDNRTPNMYHVTCSIMISS